MIRNPLRISFQPVIMILLIAAMESGLAFPAKADIFRYQDEKGVVHFTNVPTGSKFQLYYKETQSNQPSSPLQGPRKILSSKTSNTDYTAILGPHIEEASQQYNIDPKLIQAVIRVESNYDPRALSPKGAQGLMQLMPQTARDLQVTDPFSPKENIEGGTRYLRYLLDTFNQDVELALAAYNAGPEKVNLYRGIPPYLETKSYVQKVMQIYNRLKSQLLSSR